MLKSICMTLALFACLMLSGCTQAEKQADIAALKSAAIKAAPTVSKQLTITALNKAETIAPNSTQAAANALVLMLGNDLIPYFKSQPVIAASALQDLMSTKFRSTIPSQAAAALDFGAVTASMISAIAIPPASKLTPAECQIIVDNLTAMQAGAQQWLAALPAPAASSGPPATAPVILPGQ